MADTIVVVRDSTRVVVRDTTRAPVLVNTPGLQGAPGVGIELRGTYATKDALIAAHPTGTAGESYAVGGDLYTWDADAGAWANAGSFRGPAGTPGQIRFTGAGAPPTVIVGAEPGDTYLDTVSGNVYKLT